MILRPGLYPINGHDLELLVAVITEWCGSRNRYECYVNVPRSGPPVLCRPVDEIAIVMLQDAHLLPGHLSSHEPSQTSSWPHLTLL